MPHKLFSNKNFLLLLQGQSVTLAGTSIYIVGLTLWLKEATGSSTVIGLLHMVGIIPSVLLGPICGTIVDRYSRKKIIVLTDTLSGLLLIGIAIPILLRPEDSTLILSLLFLTMLIRGILSALFQPAINAALPSLVASKELDAANGILQSSSQISLIIGQLLGGVLFIALGFPALILVNGLSFLLSAWSEYFIALPHNKQRKTTNWRITVNAFKADTLEGFRYIRYKPGLLTLFLVMTITTFFIAPLGILMPFFVEDSLKATPKWYGFLLAGFASGMFLGGILLAFISVASTIRSKLVICALALFSACFISLGHTVTAQAALVMVIGMGTCYAIMGVLIRSVIQRSTPSDIRGRVFGLLATATLALAPFSIGLAGIVGDLIDHNVSLIYTVCGICSLITVCLLLFSRGFQQLMSFDYYISDNPEKVGS